MGNKDVFLTRLPTRSTFPPSTEGSVLLWECVGLLIIILLQILFSACRDFLTTPGVIYLLTVSNSIIPTHGISDSYQSR
jgi:cobalamin synthase